MICFETVIRFARIGDAALAAKAPTHWREKAAAKRFERDRNQELVVGGLLVSMLEEVAPAALAGGDPEIRLTAAGKPLLAAMPEVCFSLSHSDEVVMAAVSLRPVGCDVEKVEPLSSELAAQIGSIEAWTFREALYKCGNPAARVRAVPAPRGYAAAVAD